MNKDKNLYSPKRKNFDLINRKNEFINEIERRYNESTVNKNYVFPRGEKKLSSTSSQAHISKLKIQSNPKSKRLKTEGNEIRQSENEFNFESELEDCGSLNLSPPIKKKLIDIQTQQTILSVLSKKLNINSLLEYAQNNKKKDKNDIRYSIGNDNPYSILKQNVLKRNNSEPKNKIKDTSRTLKTINDEAQNPKVKTHLRVPTSSSILTQMKMNHSSQPKYLEQFKPQFILKNTQVQEFRNYVMKFLQKLLRRKSRRCSPTDKVNNAINNPQSLYSHTYLKGEKISKNTQFQQIPPANKKKLQRCSLSLNQEYMLNILNQQKIQAKSKLRTQVSQPVFTFNNSQLNLNLNFNGDNKQPSSKILLNQIPKRDDKKFKLKDSTSQSKTPYRCQTEPLETKKRAQPSKSPQMSNTTNFIQQVTNEYVKQFEQMNKKTNTKGMKQMKLTIEPFQY